LIEENACQAKLILYGELRTDTGSELEYSIGVVYGTNPRAPDKTLLARLEYEFFELNPGQCRFHQARSSFLDTGKYKF
jgi:hypothetical protein